MDLLAGVNHIAVMTADLDRFVEFYTTCSTSTSSSKRPRRRSDTPSSARDRTRGSTPPRSRSSRFATASPDMFQRGHLDHLALTAASPEAFEAISDRLVRRGASDGTIDDLGAFHSIWFEDPDGMRGEVVLIVDDRLQDIHAPRPLQRSNLTAVTLRISTSPSERPAR